MGDAPHRKREKALILCQVERAEKGLEGAELSEGQISLRLSILYRSSLSKAFFRASISFSSLFCREPIVKTKMKVRAQNTP
jgi:hypothetical protein